MHSRYQAEIEQLYNQLEQIQLNMSARHMRMIRRTKDGWKIVWMFCETMQIGDKGKLTQDAVSMDGTSLAREITSERQERQTDLVA